MSNAGPTTTSSFLLAALRGSDGDAWREVDRRYRGILVGFARRLGLQDEDADDVAQQTLAQFVRDYQAGRYDRERGRLRAWIIGIARHRIVDLQRQQARRRERQISYDNVEVPDEARLTAFWEEEQRREVFENALRLLREQTRTTPMTLHIFEQVALLGADPQAVAELSQTNVAEVYRIKNRITKRLREIVDELNAAYAEDD
ncbi:MAG: hypothetical protein CHACPFDD_03606 [Phycisphaerae bacterium]|nr:hypothetical protein [Phycisphaerae bacterium]